MKRVIYFLVVFGFLFASACTKTGADVVLQKIAFTPETLTVSVGSIKQLNPVFTPSVFSSIPVDWSSTDNTVIGVSSTGYLQPLKKGEAWVKIKDKNSATTGKCLIIVQ